MSDDIVRLKDRLSRVLGDNAAARAALAQAGPALDNQRNAPRKPSRLPGYVKVDGRQRMISCTVKDMSATGACVRVDPGDRYLSEDVFSFPDYITLFITYDRVRVECQIVWRRAESNEIGVQFSSVPQTY